MKNLLSTFPDKFWKPIQYTTRKPRNDRELDDYVFLTKEQFLRKLTNWDFIEFTEYNKELYAIGKYFDDTKANIFIVEPVWREAIKKYFKLNNIPYVSYYISIPKSEMLYRLWERRMSVNDTNSRLQDLKYFAPSDGDIQLDWTDREELLVKEVNKTCDL